MFAVNAQDIQAHLPFTGLIDLHTIVQLAYDDGLANVKTVGIKAHLSSFPRLCVAPAGCLFHPASSGRT
jgi:hypothetical protein